MSLFDRIIALAGGNRAQVRSRVYTRYAWTAERADHLAPHIAQLRQAGYADRLAELAGVLGLDHEPQLRNADVIAGIRTDARQVAAGVMSTHNDALRQTIAGQLAADPPPTQRELSAFVRAWERDRAGERADLITETEQANGREQAFRDVLDRNAFTLSVRAEPREAGCDRCQELVDMGTVPADGAPALPAHPRCRHSYRPQPAALRAQAEQRGSVWLGGEDEIELAEPAVRELLALTDAALRRPRRDVLVALAAAWAELAEAVA